MATLKLAGLDHRPLLFATSSTEVAIEQAVAQRALDLQREISERRDTDLATRISNGVGQIVGEHLNAALQSIARAMGS